MRKERQWTEIVVGIDFLKRDIINSVTKVGPDCLNVNFEHPVLGTIAEIYTVSPGSLRLRCIYPQEMQEHDHVEIVKDYYNGFLLGGEETYLEYFNKSVGYFLLSRNVRETAEI